MKRICVAAALLVLCAVATGSGAAATGSKQPVAISIKPRMTGDTFTLAPLTGGGLAPDAGRVTWTTTSQRMVVRNRERIRRWIGTGTFTGREGTIVLDMRIDWFDAGNGHEAGSGTWRVARGTGSYANLGGGGTSAHVWLPRGPASARIAGTVQPR